MVFLPPIINNNFIQVYYTAALNERYYGKLQGRKNRKWKKNTEGKSLLPGTWTLSQACLIDSGLSEVESLKAVYKCVVPYFKQKLMHTVKEGKNVVVCVHHSSLRALVKYI